jgi:hypothetical protein
MVCCTCGGLALQWLPTRWAALRWAVLRSVAPPIGLLARGGGAGMGPLDGVRVIEIASLAPAPFGCMVLADLGADVLRVDRPDRSGRQALPPVDPLCRGRRSIRLNLKDPAGVDVLLRLTGAAWRSGSVSGLMCAQRATHGWSTPG